MLMSNPETPAEGSPTTACGPVENSPETEPAIFASDHQTTSRPAARRRAGLLLLALKASLSAALIYWIIHSTPLDDVWTAWRQANVMFVLAALASNLLGYWISAGRWRALLRAQGGDARMTRLVGWFMAAIFFNNLLPSTIGGDALRLYDTWRVLGSKTAALAVIFVDRALGLLAMLLFALGALLAFGRVVEDQAPLLYTIVLIGTAGLLSGLLALLAPPRFLCSAAGRLQSWLPARLARLQERTHVAVTAFRHRRASVGRALGLAVLLQVNVVFYHYLIARALHLGVPFHGFFLIWPLVALIMTLPVSINGIGLRENACIVLLAFYGVSRPEAVAFAWLAFGLLLVQGLAGGVVYAFRR
jgi:uncharacterized protein (TIRG00374 family)